MSAKANRRRPVVKKVTFTRDEWEAADRFYQRVKGAHGGTYSFSAHARQLLLHAQTIVVTVALDPHMVRAEMARIGNNINQIAHKANTYDAVTRDDLRSVLSSQEELRSLFLRMSREHDMQLKDTGWRSSR